MAGPYSIFFRPDEPEGSRLAPEVIEEIKVVAPSTVDDGSITDDKLADDAVIERTIMDAAVTTDKVADLAITTAKLANEAVTTDKIDDLAVTRPKAGTGVMTSVDSTGSAIKLEARRVTAAEMAAITVPDPNTLYLISA